MSEVMEQFRIAKNIVKSIVEARNPREVYVELKRFEEAIRREIEIPELRNLIEIIARLRMIESDRRIVHPELVEEIIRRFNRIIEEYSRDPRSISELYDIIAALPLSSRDRLALIEKLESEAKKIEREYGRPWWRVIW